MPNITSMTATMDILMSLDANPCAQQDFVLPA